MEWIQTLNCNKNLLAAIFFSFCICLIGGWYVHIYSCVLLRVESILMDQAKTKLPVYNVSQTIGILRQLFHIKLSMRQNIATSTLHSDAAHQMAQQQTNW